MEKLINQDLLELSKKLDFLLKLNTDFISYSHDEIVRLSKKLDKAASQPDSDGNVAEAVARIKVMLEHNVNEIEQESHDSIESLERNQKIISALDGLDSGNRKSELITLFVQESGESENFEAFKVRVLKEELERRKSFKTFIQDIEQTVEEGGSLELEAFLEEQLLNQAHKHLSQEEDLSDHEDELNDEELKNFFEKFKDPYSK